MNKMTWILGLLLSAQAYSAKVETTADWNKAGYKVRNLIRSKKRINKKAKNVIIFIGDGMSSATITASRIHQGQIKGGFGEGNLLSFEKFDELGLSKTYNTNQQTPDSAGTATAIMTGVKTKAGMISIGSSQKRASCLKKNEELKTIIEWAEEKGLATGVVSAARITHTPATTFAHVSERPGK